MSRIRVAVIRGGLDECFKRSLVTGTMVHTHVYADDFDIVDIIIAKSGEWLRDGRVCFPEQILHSVDVVFNALHGAYGADGSIQRLCDRYVVPYTGSGAFAANIAKNKALTKNFLKETGIKVPPHILVTRDSLPEVQRIATNITSLFGPQYVIKPVSAHTRTGTMMVKNPQLLAQALTDALKTYEEVMVEAMVSGREAACGVIERYRDIPLYTLPPVEIVSPYFPSSEHIAEKRTTEMFCPARFNTDLKEQIERIASLVHTELNLSQYSRSDFVIAHDGVYFIDVRPLPAIDMESLFSRAMQAVGSTHREFITHLIIDALQNRKK